MRSMKLVGIAAVAVLALAAFGATSAFANNPKWTEGAAGTETEVELTAANGNIKEVKANGTQTLITEGVSTVECTGTSVQAGAKLETGGKDKETIVYSNCTVHNQSPCTVNSTGAAAGEIVTKPLTSHLYWAKKSSAEFESDNQTVTLFTPETGTEFVELEFTGSGCNFLTAGKHKVTGEVAVNNNGANVTLNEKIHEIEAPTTVIKEVWENNGGVVSKKTVSTLTVSGFVSARYEGKAEVELAQAYSAT